MNDVEMDEEMPLAGAPYEYDISSDEEDDDANLFFVTGVWKTCLCTYPTFRVLTLSPSCLSKFARRD